METNTIMTGNKLLRGIKPLLAGAAVSFAAILLLALLMLKLDWGASQIRVGVLIIYGTACFIGGMCAGNTTGRRRYLTGLGYGGVYFAALWALSLLGGRQFAGTASGIAAVFLICGLGGMAGGIFSGFLK